MSDFIKDIENNPDIFDLNGAIPLDEISGWSEENSFEIPDDLKEFWSLTGGGYMFESENFLAPDLNFSGEDILSTNQWYWENGLPEEFLIYNTGAFLSAINLNDGKYYLLDNQDFFTEKIFDNLEDWYKNTLKAEFGERYGL